MKNVLLIFLLFVSLTATAQNTGRIKGVVTDSITKALLVDVIVLLTDSTKPDRIEFTNVAGEYAFTNLPEGMYSLTFTLFGSRPVKILNVPVKADKITFLSPAIVPGQIIICGGPVLQGPYNLDDNPSSTTYYGDDIRKMAVPR